MKTAAQTLPDNPELLQQIIKNQNTIILSLQAQIAALKRDRFGRSSEKLDHQIEQLELILDDMAYQGVDVDISEPDQYLSETPKSKPARQKLPDDLPREEIIHEPAQKCPECGNEGFSKLGEDVTEVLDYVPAHFKVLRHVRPKHSCRKCESIRQAELPSMPIRLPQDCLLISLYQNIVIICRFTVSQRSKASTKVWIAPDTDLA